MNEKFLKPYNPSETEARIRELWDTSGYANPDNLPVNKNGRFTEPFCIIMPPPNANGHLHAGHALTLTLQDIIIRYKRMQGYKTLWLPGADHAGFETQVVYEKKLEKEGRSRFKMDRQDLYNEIYAFTMENKKFMEEEVRKMGSSCDWSREKFTLDPDIVKEVQRTFEKLFNDDLVYRGSRIINWCSKHQTSLSDVETESKTQKDPFYYFKYGPFTIATARPETKFGDKYVVMHPDDKRYAEYKEGQKIPLEWINGPIVATVIKDTAIDMEFGSGVMTITPWHSGIDFEIAERHGLDKEQIIDEFGKLLPIAAEFAGMKIAEARPKIVEKLKAKGLLVKVEENYEHSVPCCYKCGTAIEPQIKEQWFLKMKSLAEMALKAVSEEKVTFLPDNFRKIFNYWMENSMDWNISRQIVWGIPIPAKKCEKCSIYIVDVENTISSCAKCRGELVKETDTFDTWFSSGQWPLLTLGFPDGKDFKTFYPTDVMETGSDLIFKWVPRMVIFGLYLAGKEPFKQVYLHGMVNDAQGKKMSKSKGNVVNPLDLMEKFGTDALRMALIIGNTPGGEMALREDKIKGYKNFANKIWNATRFVLTAIDGAEISAEIAKQPKLLPEHQEYIKELNAVLADVTSDMDNSRYYLAGEKLYHYFWHVFADKIIEASKAHLPQFGPKAADVKEELTSEQKSARISAQWTLLHILTNSIKPLHPFMPYVTEEIWQELSGKNPSILMIEPWPHPSE